MSVRDSPDAPAFPGQPGSWSLPGGGSDGPWLPATALAGTVAVPVGATLEVAIEGAAAESWTAAYAEPSESSPEPIALGNSAEPGPGPTIAFAAPPPGDWVVQVAVELVDDGGTVAWFWHVSVGGP